MAVPRLASAQPFFLLDPSSLPVSPRAVASIKGASRYGRPVNVEELEPVDLAVVGCVAVSSDGARLGKGGGFSDLEYAVAWEAGLITAFDGHGDDGARGADRRRRPHSRDGP